LIGKGNKVRITFDGNYYTIEGSLYGKKIYKSGDEGYKVNLELLKNLAKISSVPQELLAEINQRQLILYFFSTKSFGVLAKDFILINHKNFQVIELHSYKHVGL